MSVKSSESGPCSPLNEGSHPLERGYYPYRSIWLPFDVARETKQKLINFGNAIFGVILSYPDDRDNDHFKLDPQYDQWIARRLKNADQSDPRVKHLVEEAKKPAPRFLHLFNSGEAVQVVSVKVDGVALNNIQIKPRRRISFLLESYFANSK